MTAVLCIVMDLLQPLEPGQTSLVSFFGWVSTADDKNLTLCPKENIFSKQFKW